MSYSHYYKGLIWTNHALDRLSDRRISQEWGWQTFRFPDSSHAGKKTGTTEFIKKYKDITVTVIARKNEKKEWIVLSCWVDPPLQGSIDILKRKKYLELKNAKTFMQKILIHIKYLFIPN